MAEKQSISIHDLSVYWWFEKYVRPSPGTHTYPGSSAIAVDVVPTLHVTAWDNYPPAVRSLKASLGRRHRAILGEAAPTDRAVTRADFVFIDPPSPTSWKRIKKHLLPALRHDANVLIWLPLSSKGSAREFLLPEGYSGRQVRWMTGGGQQTVGCRLVYRFAEPAAKAAVEKTVEDVANLWQPSWRLGSPASYFPTSRTVPSSGAERPLPGRVIRAS